MSGGLSVFIESLSAEDVRRIATSGGDEEVAAVLVALVESYKCIVSGVRHSLEATDRIESGLIMADFNLRGHGRDVSALDARIKAVEGRLDNLVNRVESMDEQLGSLGSLGSLGPRGGLRPRKRTADEAMGVSESRAADYLWPLKRLATRARAISEEIPYDSPASEPAPSPTPAPASTPVPLITLDFPGVTPRARACVRKSGPSVPTIVLDVPSVSRLRALGRRTGPKSHH